MLYFITSWKIKMQLKHKKFRAVSGQGAVTDGSCQKWFAKFPGTTDILAK